MDKIFTLLKSFRGEVKKSRFKIWLRAFLFVLFSTIFSIYFVRDIANGHFSWGWVALVFVLFIPVGFWMSRLVPMQANHEESAVTLSFDLVYFILIWVLVIAKLIMGHIPSLIVISDVIMCAIMGVMFGRLGGIGLRVRYLKLQHGFIKA
jgi:hypothetical protein